MIWSDAVYLTQVSSSPRRAAGLLLKDHGVLLESEMNWLRRRYYRQRERLLLKLIYKLKEVKL